MWDCTSKIAKIFRETVWTTPTLYTDISYQHLMNLKRRVSWFKVSTTKEIKIFVNSDKKTIIASNGRLIHYNGYLDQD